MLRRSAHTRVTRRRAGGAAPLAAVVLSCLGTGPGVSAEVRYKLLDLGTLGGTYSGTLGYGVLNGAGQVVGQSTLSGGGAPHAFRTGAGAPITSASNINATSATGSTANAVNDAGQVVGWSFGAGALATAFRTTANGSITTAADLGHLGGGESYANGINASGQTVGSSALGGTSSGSVHAFRTTATGKISDDGADLGTLGGTSSGAFGINASGQAVGWSTPTGGGAPRAFRTAPNGPITPQSDLGTLGGSGSTAYAINDAGRTVGYARTGAGHEHAFRTTANGLINAAGDLGTLGGTSSAAFAINTAGQTVGRSTLAGDAVTHAFFVDAAGGLIDLNTLIPSKTGWVLNEARGINDAGQIAGFGVSRTGAEHAFLLTPAMPGDATGDWKVDFNDLVLLAQRYNSLDGKATWEQGDFTGEGNVDFSDLTILAQRYGAPAAGAAAALPADFAADFQSAMASVPEPGGAGLVALAGWTLRRRKRRA
jgi:probable HAF family extracellular repeat protein